MEEVGESLPGLFLAESYDTALCLLPPRSAWDAIDRFRALNDRAYGRWPPHVNLVYPFVSKSALDAAAQVLCRHDYSGFSSLQVSLSQVDTFDHKQDRTIHLRPATGTDNQRLAALGRSLSKAFGRSSSKELRPHLTVAQATTPSQDASEFLLDKARLLTPLGWTASEIAILVRESHDNGPYAVRWMQLWGTIDIVTGSLIRDEGHTGFYSETLLQNAHLQASSVRRQTGFMFSSAAQRWEELSDSSLAQAPDSLKPLDRLVVASYNVLAEFEWPPAKTRHAHLVKNICSKRAMADILVLQEVTDAFLEHLLSDPTVCQRYPFATHGKPSSPAVGPLPNFLNIVVLSSLPMRWEYLEHSRKHKGSAVVLFPTIRLQCVEGNEVLPLVLAACHLSQGLTDGSVAAKKQEIQDVMQRLQSGYARHSWLLAGDFNLTTSSFTVSMARKKGALTSYALEQLRGIDDILLDGGFRDVWLDTRLESGESSSTRLVNEDLGQLHEGEQGATFDPQTNTLAAKQTGFGLNTRPQRYDRIFVNNAFALRPIAFNMFGQEAWNCAEGKAAQHASDHWGVRCLLQASGNDSTSLSPLVSRRDIVLQRASSSLGGTDDLTSCLRDRGLLPTPEQRAAREQALDLLRQVLMDEMSRRSDMDSHFKPVLVLMPVGSTALGVWTPSSDVDCLCIGGISSKTFFAIALKRLRRAASDGITILRKVQASSGTMLELIVRDIRFDLQYCPAISIAEQYPEVMNRPSTDPAFSLPMQTLLKLKPARDLSYLRRSIPDMAQYRAAHLLIKAWAMSRGLYAAKFGFLGGIHLSVLLVPICKSLAASGQSMSAADIVATFFHHYASFDWAKNMVFDPFFHRSTRYHRSFREPLCLLGWHAPSLNTAAAASIPTVKTLTAEFERADQLLSLSTASWETFLGTGRGDVDFVSRYQSYIRIDMHYWGPSPSKGNRMIGWVESRCAMLLVDLDRKVPAVLPRIWPQRFIKKQDEIHKVSATEYQGCCLVGLEPKGETSSAAAAADVRARDSTLVAVLKDFEAKLKADETYYDPQTCWLSLTLLRKTDLEPLEADSSPWGSTLPANAQWADDFDSEDEDEDVDVDEELGEEEDTKVTGGAATPATPRSRSGVVTATTSRASKVAKPQFTGLGKFRTATDVLNRLRWDPAMDSSDFIVGYEDRFAGAQEKILDKWKSDLTHEEFIPQHRILYFKRRGDGVKVWERNTRIDSIFGSGIGS